MDGWPTSSGHQHQAQRTTDLVIRCWEEGHQEYQKFINTLKALNLRYKNKRTHYETPMKQTKETDNEDEQEDQDEGGQ